MSTRASAFATVLLLLVAPAWSISLPSSCPAASTSAINCTQGSAYALPTSVAGVCGCQCGTSSQSAVSSDSNGNWMQFQAASAACTTAGCASAYPTICANMAYQSASWTSTAAFNAQQGLNGPSGCTASNGNCNIGPSSNPTGTICVGIAFTCNAAAMAAGECNQGLSGATITQFAGVTAAQCISLVTTPNASSFVTNYIGCSTNMCNTLAALTATSGASRTPTIRASIGAALIAIASML